KVGKFARRNRVQIAAAAVIILLWAAVNFASRGRQNKQQPQAEAASLYRLPAGSDALIGLRESTAEVRGIMESRARNTLSSAALYRAIASQELGDREAQAGDPAEAKRAYLDAASLAKVHLGGSDPTFVMIYIASSKKLGLNAIALGQRDEALVFGRDAVE